MFCPNSVCCLLFAVCCLLTFHQLSIISSLPCRQNGLHKDTNISLSRVPPTHNRKPKRLLSVALFEDHCVEVLRCTGISSLPRKSAVARQLPVCSCGGGGDRGSFPRRVCWRSCI